MKQKSEANHLLEDFYCGGIGGLLTGPLISGFEMLKVKLQEQAIEDRKNGISSEGWKQTLLRLKKVNKRQWLKAALFSTPQFSLSYGAVCALEFSINSRIKKRFGELSGLIPSAFTGSLFLTAAEHIMFRAGQPGQNVRKAFASITKNSYGNLFIGMNSMFVREAFFMFNLFYGGVYIGKILEKAFSQDSSNGENKNQQFWKGLGRMVFSIPLITLTHPFDTAAREMQYQFFENPNCKPSLIRVFREVSLKKLLLPGLLPRLLLASTGGTIAAHIFEVQRSKFD